MDLDADGVAMDSKQPENFRKDPRHPGQSEWTGQEQLLLPLVHELQLSLIFWDESECAGKHLSDQWRWYAFRTAVRIEPTWGLHFGVRNHKEFVQG